MSPETDPTAAVDLASEPDFRLGELLVSPSACRAAVDEQEARVEPRVMEVFVVLARRAGHTVSRDQLIDACWGGRAVSDDAVTRVVAQLRQLGRNFDPPPFALETVPKVGFRLILPKSAESRVGDDGGGSDATEAPAAPALPVAATHRRPMRLILAVLALLVVGGGGLILWRTMALRGGVPGQSGRVEVMRFEARGSDPAIQQVSTEIGDSVIRILSGEGVIVAPHAATPGDGQSTNDAELRVGGSVGREGDALVVNAQVIDRRSGLVLWSGRLDRPAANATGFGEEVGQAVTATFYCAFADRQWSHRRMKPAVFSLYLSTCDAIVRDGNPPRMLEAARRLVSAAPDLAIAQAMYGIAQAQTAGWTDYSPHQIEAMRRGARESAARALKLDARTPKAYLAIASSYPDGSNWAAKEDALRRAHEIDPTLTPGRGSYIELLREVGRLDEAIETANNLEAVGDPRTLGGSLVPLAFMYAQKGDLASSDAALRKVELGGGNGLTEVRWTIAAWWRDPATARETLRQLGAGRHDLNSVACMDAFLTNLSKALPGATRGLPATCALVSADWRVRMLAREGDVDGAYAESAKPRLNTHNSTSLFFYPEMKAFRRDARFMPLAKRLGLAGYWEKTNRWPDFCAEPDLPYDCRAVAKTL